MREMHVASRRYLDAEQAAGDMDVSQFERELGDLIYFEDISDDEPLEDTMSEEDSWENKGDGVSSEDEDEPIWKYLWEKRRYFWEDMDWTWCFEGWTDEDLDLWAYLMTKRRDDNSREEFLENRGEEGPWEEDPYQNRHEALFRYLRGEREEDCPPVFTTGNCGDEDEEAHHEEEEEGVWVEDEDEEEEGEEEDPSKQNTPSECPLDWGDGEEEEEVEPCKEVSYDPAYWEYLCEHKEEEPYCTAYWEYLWMNTEEDSSEEEPYYQDETRETGSQKDTRDNMNQEESWDREHREYPECLQSNGEEYDLCEEEEGSSENGSQEESWEKVDQKDSLETPNQGDSREGAGEDSCKGIDEDSLEGVDENSSEVTNDEDSWEIVDKEGSEIWAWITWVDVSAGEDGEASVWRTETVLGSGSGDDGWEIESLTSSDLEGDLDLTAEELDVGAVGQGGGSRVLPEKMTGRMGNQRVTIHNPRVLFADKELGFLVVKGRVAVPKGAVIQVPTEEKSIISEGLQEWADAVRALPKGTPITTLPIPVGLKKWREFMGSKAREGSQV
jgi:hypothetical protein